MCAASVSANIDDGVLAKVDELILSHDVVPAVLIDCAATAVPSITAHSFLERSVHGDIVVFVAKSADAHTMLTHYLDSKSLNPQLSALFVLPVVKKSLLATSLERHDKI